MHIKDSLAYLHLTDKINLTFEFGPKSSLFDYTQKEVLGLNDCCEFYMSMLNQVIFL